MPLQPFASKNLITTAVAVVCEGQMIIFVIDHIGFVRSVFI